MVKKEFGQYKEKVESRRRTQMKGGEADLGEKTREKNQNQKKKKKKRGKTNLRWEKQKASILRARGNHHWGFGE